MLEMRGRDFPIMDEFETISTDDLTGQLSLNFDLMPTASESEAIVSDPPVDSRLSPRPCLGDEYCLDDTPIATLPMDSGFSFASSGLELCQ